MHNLISLNTCQDNVFFFPSIFCISFAGKTIVAIQGQHIATTIKMKLMEAFEVCINNSHLKLVVALLAR